MGDQGGRMSGDAQARLAGAAVESPQNPDHAPGHSITAEAPQGETR